MTKRRKITTELLLNFEHKHYKILSDLGMVPSGAKQSKRRMVSAYHFKSGSVVEVEAGHILNNHEHGKSHVQNKSVTNVSKRPLYFTWKAMNSRCYNPNDKDYRNYGAKGVQVFWLWQSSPYQDGFTNFENDILETIGERPEGMTLDKDAGGGHYMPGLVRWATYHQQMMEQDVVFSPEEAAELKLLKLQGFFNVRGSIRWFAEIIGVEEHNIKHVINKSDAWGTVQPSEEIRIYFNALSQFRQLLNSKDRAKKERNAKVIKMREKGKTWQAIADDFGVHIKTPQKWLK